MEAQQSNPSGTLGFWIPRRGFWTLNSGFFVSEIWGPDFLRFILGSKAQDSGLEKETLPVSLFHKQKFPTFPYMGRNPQQSRILDSTL